MPIVMLHEGLGSVAMWRDFPDQLAAATGRQVIAFSRRGYGWSAPFEQPFDLDFMHREAEAAATLLTGLGVERAHIFGHSDGASIALLLAARWPDRVASLLLEAPHVFVEPVCIDAISTLSGACGLDGFVARLGRYHRDAPGVFEQWTRIWSDPRFRAWSIEGDIASIIAPMLLVQGEEDEYGSFLQLDRIAALLPQARQLRLPDCGHSPHRDQPAAVLAASASFLRELNPATLT